MQEKSNGLLVIWADIDTEYQLEFEQWHNCEHMSDRLKIPGFRIGFRYQGIGNSPYALMAYETSSSAVMESEPYLLSKNNPTPWTRKVLSYQKNTGRGIYNLAASVGDIPVTQAPYLFILRFDSESDNDAENLEGIQDRFLEMLITIPETERARFYRLDKKISGIVTAEQEICGGSLQMMKRFLILVEMTSAYFTQKETWQNLLRRAQMDAESSIRVKNVSAENYWLRFVMQVPSFR